MSARKQNRTRPVYFAWIADTAAAFEELAQDLAARGLVSDAGAHVSRWSGYFYMVPASPESTAAVVGEAERAGFAQIFKHIRPPPGSFTDQSDVFVGSGVAPLPPAWY